MEPGAHSKEKIVDRHRKEVYNMGVLITHLT